MKTTTLAFLALASASLASGCAATTTAIVDGQTVPRLDLAFSGRPYLVRHHRAHPRPGAPSGGLKDGGGDIVGQVCGMDVDFEVTHEGDHVQLVGYLDNTFSAHLEIKDDGPARRITGALGTRGVELLLSPEGLRGHVGVRVFALPAEGDRLVGRMKIPVSPPNEFNVHIDGVKELMALPAADQAALLPTVLMCVFGNSSTHMEIDELNIQFGGPQGNAPVKTSGLYTY